MHWFSSPKSFLFCTPSTHLPSELIWLFRCGSHSYNWETDLLKEDFGLSNRKDNNNLWKLNVWNIQWWKSTFTQVMYLSIILRYLCFTWVFLFYATSYFNFITFQGEILYFLLHYIYLIAVVTSYFSGEDLTQWIIKQMFKIQHIVKD